MKLYLQSLHKPKILDVLDLMMPSSTINYDFKTQSTDFADQLFKSKQGISRAGLIDSFLSNEPHPIYFMPKITQHMAIKSTDIPEFYSDLITKFLHQNDSRALFDQICNQCSFIDPVHYECLGREYEIVLRVWHSQTQQQRSSRLLYISSSQHTSSDVLLFYRVWGQIDLVMIPVTANYDHAMHINWIGSKHFGALSQLSMHTLIRISKYLDHGQCLNLRTLDSFMPHYKIQQALAINSNDAYRQHLRDYYHYQQSVPNARSLAFFPRSKHVTHMTKFKVEICNSGMISTSNGGCLGNVIYSVKVLTDQSGQEYMSGMSLGLVARLYSSTVLDQEKIFLFAIKEQKNFLSNWINGFGFGRLKLEAMLLMATQPEYSFMLHKACRESLFLYKRMRPLLVHFKNYCAKRVWIENLNARQQAILINMEFKNFWALFSVMRVLPQNYNGLGQFYLLNNLLFEILKDYILLHQTTCDQNLFTELGSYDMYNQYQFFFAIDPDLKNKGFKTEFFSPDYASIVENLINHNALNRNDLEGELRLKKFLLDRFSAAVNIFFLENQTAPDIKPKIFTDHQHFMHPFIDYALILPNLFGNIIHSVLSKVQNPSPRAQKLLKDYHQQLRHLYDLSYDERNITMPIKANLFETDEVGVRQLDSNSVHDLQLQEVQTSLYKITNISPPLPIILKGVSDRVQLRAEECEHINIFKTLALQAALVNRFGLHFLTYHPDIIYKRMKYLPELVSHLPQQEIYLRSLNGLSSSTYTRTNYLNASQAENYRVYIKNGLIVSRCNEEDVPYSCANGDVMVCQSLNGNIYSAQKINQLQHSSFNAGGYLLFAGYWHVHEGVIQSIHAESGHYEPSLVALQNFVYLLSLASCDLSMTKFFHTVRKLHEHPTEILNFVKTEHAYDLNTLLTPQVIEPKPSDAVLFVTPKVLHCLSKVSIFSQKIVRNFTSSSLITPCRGPV
jgi:hypothetical protein